MKRMVEIVHDELKDNHYNIAIDFSMGNGNDTYFLGKICNVVYSFDIQQIALDNTSLLIKDLNNVNLILDSHENFDKYVSNFDVGIFNLGYLPNGDKSITTMSDVTLKTINKAIIRLNNKGVIYIVVYVGHLEGQRESEKINNYINKLQRDLFQVTIYKEENKNKAPYIVKIEKKG